MDKISNTHLRFLEENDRELDHKCNLELHRPAAHQCLTSIIATISRNCRTFENIIAMLGNGMRIARINMAHHSHDYHADSIKLLRIASTRYDQKRGFKCGLAIALELRGPQIHSGYLACGEDIRIEAGEKFQLSANKEDFYKGKRGFIFVGYPNMTNFVFPGHRVILDDGEIILIVRDVGTDVLFCDVSKGGILKNSKVVKFPDSQIELPSVTERDIFDLQFAVEKDVDMIIAPQIRNAAGVYEIKNLLGRKGAHILIISKIENKDSLTNIDEIIDASDAILFARGDLYLEVAIAKLYIAQKAVMAKCQRKGKPFICGNWVLSSMIHGTEPTCSEITELGGAISDGVDCIMLTTATAIGEHPVEAVEMAEKICKEAELATWHNEFYNAMISLDRIVVDANYGTAITTISMAKKSFASGIIILTTTGKSANLLSRYKPRCPIFAVTRCELTFRRLKLFRGVIPVLYNSKFSNTVENFWYDRFDARLQYALWVGKRMGFIKTSDAVIVMGPWKDPAGFSNKTRLIYAFFEEDYEIKKKVAKKKEVKQKPPNYCCRRCRK